MQPIEGYRYVGVLASFMAWLAIAVVLLRWPILKHNSISKHVSAYKQAWLLFAPIETVGLCLFYVFMVNWFIPVLALPMVYTVLITAVLALEFVTTWVPDTTGLKQRVHHYTAYSAALLNPVLAFFIVASPRASTVARIIACMAIVVMVGIFYMYLRIKTTREKHLIYQSIYFACFHIPVLTVIFTVG